MGKRAAAVRSWQVPFDGESGERKVALARRPGQTLSTRYDASMGSPSASAGVHVDLKSRRLRSDWSDWHLAFRAMACAICLDSFRRHTGLDELLDP